MIMENEARITPEEAWENIGRYIEAHPGDGYYYGIGKDGQLVKIKPPVHVNCRCLTIPMDE